MSTITFGIYVPQVSFDYASILDRAILAEEVGFDSLWFFDHLYSPGQPDRPSYEGWTLASYVLAQTTRLRVGHLVVTTTSATRPCSGEMATTLDVLSEGRLELGLGQRIVRGGAPRGRFRVGHACGTVGPPRGVPGDPHPHVRRRPNHVRGRPITRCDDLPNLPRPIQTPRPPIYIGGVGVRHTMPLVARYADVWNIPTYGLARWEESERVLERECASIGRDPSTIRRSQEAMLVLAPDESSLEPALANAQRRFGDEGWGLHAGGYIGTPPMVVDRIGQLVDKGITSFVFFTSDRAEPRTLELFAQQVMPEFS